MVKFNELNTNKIKKTGNSKLYKNILKLLMSAGLLSTALTGCAPEEQITDPIVVDPAEPTDPVVEKSQIEILAEEYEFLAWYLDDSTSKTVDGVTYDLSALKQQYGDLYRFVEPLSKEEVEHRFQYLAEYFAEQAEKGIYEDYAGGMNVASDETHTIISNRVQKTYEDLDKATYDELSKFSNYYFYLSKTGNYYGAIFLSVGVGDL